MTSPFPGMDPYLEQSSFPWPHGCRIVSYSRSLK
ncbi:DUF4058 family protein [Leptolyngbya sp. BL0902]